MANNRTLNFYIEIFKNRIFRIFLILFISFIIYFIYADFDKINYSELDCSGMNMMDTAFCLNSFVNDNFNYVPHSDNLYFEPSELEKSGGDCTDYSRFYKSELDKYGFNSQMIEIPINENISHLIVISFDYEGYCLLDMTHINCYTYENG